LHTALRENEEELGVPRSQVTVLGMLDETPTITRFRVTPFVGVIPPDGAYQPNPVEIEEIIEVPLAHLLHPGNSRTERGQVSEEERELHFFNFESHVIWGATARILKSLLHVGASLPSFEKLRSSG
jgi:8-oxo-dGTP pyrophosphatase MutT (NUDIX family)